MKKAIYIRKNFTGYGHYKITLTIENEDGQRKELIHITTDMQAIDCWDDTESDYYEPCGAIVLAQRTLYKNDLDEDDVNLDELKEQFKN